MNGISEFTAQFEAKLNLFEACKTALKGQDVDVAFGFRWPVESHDWVAVVDTTSDMDLKTIPNRQMDERITLGLSVGSWRSGNDSETGTV